MIKACLTVEGKVQKVGYRDKVQEIARQCKLVGKVKNMEDGAVRIICEGEKKVIEDFKKRIKIKDELIDVKNISAAYEEPTGEFKYFKIGYGEVAEEIAESIGAGRRELVAVKQEVGGLRGDVGSLREDTSQGLSAVKQEVGSLKQEVGGLRGDTTKGLFAVKQEVHGFRNDMNQNFDAMDKKYLRISKNIETLTREIRNSNKNIQLLAKTFVKMVNALEKK
ncbi:MAG: acylphosphatase [Candidatus Hydrothermarchaeota archaeon]|nr:acylphosphatase [Candidatus Hydrothermarchaeota archaeon]